MYEKSLAPDKTANKTILPFFVQLPYKTCCSVPRKVTKIMPAMDNLAAYTKIHYVV